MKTIWKLQLNPEKEVYEIPQGAEILSVQTQLGNPCIWFMCNPNARPETRRFVIIGTGHEIVVENLKFIGTFQLHEGKLVFHLFEVIKK